MYGAMGFAQESASANPYSSFNKMAYQRMGDILVRSAEKMPEENYSFKPADSVRSYGQLVGHLADAQYFFCSTATGDKNPDLNIEKTKTSKADLIAALKGAIAYCNKAYDGMNDTSGAQTVKLFGTMDMPRLGVLTVNLMHDDEHYGNLVTYMRMKNIVPPTSEQPTSPPPPAKK
jgi:uncharacterized damage-inducible protein DinB